MDKRMEIVGTEQPLKMGPGTHEHEGKTGHPMKEIIGDRIPISYTPAPNVHNENIREGKMDIVGTSCGKLSSAAHKSFESMETPMSQRVKVEK